METETGDVLDKHALGKILGYSTRWIDERLKLRRFPIPPLDGLGKKKRWSRASVDRYLAGRR